MRLLGLEAGIDARQLEEAADQQAGAGQQHDGERHLGDDQRRAHAMRRRRWRRRAPPSRSALRSSARRWPAAPAACRRPGSSTSAIAKREQRPRCRSTPISSSRGMSAGCAAIERLACPSRRARGRAHGAGEAEHDRLGEQLPQQPAAAGAERGAHRQLACRADAAREQQVGDIARTRRAARSRRRRAARAAASARRRRSCRRAAALVNVSAAVGLAETSPAAACRSAAGRRRPAAASTPGFARPITARNSDASSLSRSRR